MLISCPKCHSIYEIPDDLIGRTGKKFRCPVCAHIWHAMREDALGYDNKNKDDIPYIEAIYVKDALSRNFPADKSTYNVPADSKSGRRTKSSKEILADKSITETNKSGKNKEITLTSEKGTSFTISTIPEEDFDDKETSHWFDKEESIHADKDNRLLPEKPFKGYIKTKIFLFLLLLCILAVFLRREVVAFYPASETWYNKIMLSGLNNPQYLKFNKINTALEQNEDKALLKITAEITNPSHYTTHIPLLTVNGKAQDFKLDKDTLGAKESTLAEITLPAPEGDSYQNLTLGFQKP